MINKGIAIIILLACGLLPTQAHNEVSISGGYQLADGLKIGNSTNYILIDPDTGVTFTGGSYRLSMRPYIEAGKIGAQTKPTIVDLGAVTGYSLPLYATDEEIKFNEYIAGRWDGASNITVAVIGYLDTAETADDDFNLTLEWANHVTGSGQLSSSVNTVYQVTNCPAGRNAQYSIYKVEFPIDWDAPTPDIAASDFFAGRLYRSAVGSGNVEIAGEFVVTAIVITYEVDKVFKVV